MKNVFLGAVLAIVLTGIGANQTIAQTEIRHPNPAYLNREDPCPEYTAYSTHQHTVLPARAILNIPNYLEYENDVCYVTSYGMEGAKQTIYGVAIPMNSYETVYPFVPPDRRVTINIMLYHFTPGDSNVQLIKSQSFVKEENQSPDVFLTYPSEEYVFRGYSGPDSLIQYPMYEFYFDSPQDVDGLFFVGVYSADDFKIPVGRLFKLIDRDTNALRPLLPECCRNRYWGLLDMDKKLLIAYTNLIMSTFASPTRVLECNGSRIQTGWTGHYWDYVYAVAAPHPDTMYSLFAPMSFPIIMPQGYLAATGPTAEAGDVRLLPNPVRGRDPMGGKVTVEADCAIRHVEVADMMGRVLIAERYDGGTRSATLDVGRLAQGSYVVKVKTERGPVAKKLMIE